jgi:hypothetical protein|tara:strand:- start:191 stop:436 length:246 start_codon:yes stop_codon:yes gene_type:complete
MTATQELVVPKSIPITLLILSSLIYGPLTPAHVGTDGQVLEFIRWVRPFQQTGNGELSGDIYGSAGGDATAEAKFSIKTLL